MANHLLPPSAALKPKAKLPTRLNGGSVNIKTDPLAPMSAQDINATINKFTSQYGNPLSETQIQTSAQGLIDPLVAAITKRANDQAAASGAQIKGLTDSYASELGKINYGAPYQTGIAQQAAVDDALRQELSGAGTDLASQLRSRLSSYGSDPAVAQAAAGQAQRGNAQATTQDVYGGDALSNLISSGAAAGSYGQKLPGLAKLSGLQELGRVKYAAQDAINTGTQGALGQLPSIVQALRSGNDSLRQNKAAAGANLFETLTGQNVTKASVGAGLDNTAFDNGLAYANTFGTDPVTGQTVKGYHTDANGNVVKDATTTKPKAPKLTAAQSQKYQGIALTIAEQGLNGAPEVKDPNTGKITDPALPKLTREEAILEMEKEGVPAKIATATANRVYGKPLTPAQKKKQDAAVKSGLGVSKTTGPFAGLTGGK